MWYAVLSRLKRVLVVAIAGACGKRGGCKRDDSGYKSHCDLGRHDHFSSGPKQIGIANWIRARRRLFLRFALSGMMAGSRPAIIRCCSACRILSDLVAVGTGPGARAVVLHRAVPARSGTSRRRNGGADGERERESQSDLAQHGHSPCVEARSGFYGLDRKTRRLFPRSHSNRVRSVQVFVCSARCALHITVICPCDRSGERPDRPSLT